MCVFFVRLFESRYNKRCKTQQNTLFRLWHVLLLCMVYMTIIRSPDIYADETIWTLGNFCLSFDGKCNKLVMLRLDDFWSFYKRSYFHVMSSMGRFLYEYSYCYQLAWDWPTFKQLEEWILSQYALVACLDGAMCSVTCKVQCK